MIRNLFFWIPYIYLFENVFVRIFIFFTTKRKKTFQNQRKKEYILFLKGEAANSLVLFDKKIEYNSYCIFPHL